MLELRNTQIGRITHERTYPKTMALSAPQQLGRPFACRTLDCLETHLNEEKKIEIRRGRIDELLIAEGLRRRTQETWIGERVDPESAEKKGLIDPLHEPA